MPSEFSSFAQSPTTPSENAFSVTTHDTEALLAIPKYLYVGTGGTVIVRSINAAADVTFVNVPDGGYLYVRAEFVRATGTTASDIVACA